MKMPQMILGSALIALLVAPPSRSRCSLPSLRAENGCGLWRGARHRLADGRVHPKGKANGLAIIDVVSGAWYSDRGKLREHTLAQVYAIFCSHGYTVFGIRPGSRTRYTPWKWMPI